MVILVYGGLDYADYDTVVETLNEVAAWNDDGSAIKVVTARRNGACDLAARWAREHGYGAHLIEAPLSGRDYAAAVTLNQNLIDTYRPDEGVVFSGDDQEVADMLTRLFHAGVNTWVVGR